jgi:hypothetical protein
MRRHDRAGDPVNLAPLQFCKKSSSIHDNVANFTATRFSCTNRNTHCDTAHGVQMMNDEANHT